VEPNDVNPTQAEHEKEGPKYKMSGKSPAIKHTKELAQK